MKKLKHTTEAELTYITGRC